MQWAEKEKSKFREVKDGKDIQQHGAQTMTKSIDNRYIETQGCSNSSLTRLQIC